MSRPLIGLVAHREAIPDDGDLVDHHVTNSAYVKAVTRAGGIPVLLPLLGSEDSRRMLDRVDGLVITGGCDIEPSRYGEDPSPHLGRTDDHRDGLELDLFDAVLGSTTPTLAVCRGCQVLNVALGGTLVQHVEDHAHLDRCNHPVHPVDVAAGSVLADWLGRPDGGPFEVNSLHHQSVGRLGAGLEISARAPDGTVEAVEVPGRPWLLGVQWHPELLRHDGAHLALFSRLVRLAAG